MKTRWYAITVLLACCAGALQSGVTSIAVSPSEQINANSKSIGGAFTLVDHRGLTRTNTDFTGKYMLIFFGYTFCPDVCPTALLRISASLALLKEMHPEQADLVQPLFITLDPVRDTQETLAQYVDFFHPDLIGLTGTEQQINEITDNYNFYYQRDTDNLDANYLIDHSSIIYLMSPNGEYIQHFTHNTPIDEIVDTFSRLLTTPNRPIATMI